MPRKRTKSLKESTTYRYCPYCKANRDKRRFDRHQAACKTIWQHQRGQQNPQLSAGHINNSPIKVNFSLPNFAAVVTRNNLKDGPQVDNDIQIPNLFDQEDEELGTAACETAEQCKC
jgi:hypothetical protein